MISAVLHQCACGSCSKLKTSQFLFMSGAYNKQSLLKRDSKILIVVRMRDLTISPVHITFESLITRAARILFSTALLKQNSGELNTMSLRIVFFKRNESILYEKRLTVFLKHNEEWKYLKTDYCSGVCGCRRPGELDGIVTLC